jgi:hypothetical protein
MATGIGVFSDSGTAVCRYAFSFVAGQSAYGNENVQSFSRNNGKAVWRFDCYTARPVRERQKRCISPAGISISEVIKARH